MNEFLYFYHPVEPTTWAYLSSLLMLGLYFKFNRFWSVRNLDLLLLILLAPGLLLVHYGQGERQAALRAQQVASVAPPGGDSLGEQSSQAPSAVGKEAATVAPLAPAVTPGEIPPSTVIESATESAAAPVATPLPRSPMDEIFGPNLAADEIALPKSAAEKQLESGRAIERGGYLWIFVAGGLLLVRLLLDSTMVRRPLLEPNLSTGGLIFIGCSLFVFLMANVIANAPTQDSRRAGSPGYALIQQLPWIRTFEAHDPAALRAVATTTPAAEASGASADVAEPATEVANAADATSTNTAHVVMARVLVVLGQLGIVLALAMIGYRHFDNIKMGAGAATMYLMLPYTAQMTGHADHVLPAALVLWGVFFYRRPLTAGLFIGLATIGYFPLYLLPLWISFYWQRGLMRFLTGVLTAITLMACLLMLAAGSVSEYLYLLRCMFGALPFRMQGLEGIWGLGWDPWFRVPMLAAFVVLSGSFALWPAQKNLGTLLSCSAAVMLGAQFWHGDGGGLYMAWYLPLLLLTIFRPNLEDRVALTVLGEGWLPRRRFLASPLEKAA
jgi:hypothetical protein